MKTTCNWLREYCAFDLAPEELARRLSMAGLLIEEIEPVGDDALIVAEVTTNRPDWLGTIGIAREVAALTGGRLRLPPTDFACSDEKVGEVTSVEVLDPDLCPRYTARVIRNVKVGPSPDWLRQRLEAIGLRAINNVVDVTNYVLFECGQPLHAFDFDRLRGGKIVVRRARKGESLVSIDETACKLDSSMLVIADAERPVAIAGVMGGLSTEVSATTTNVLLESAHFETTQVRRTSRALALPSESSYRFERGVDPVQVEWASRRAARLIQETGGGTICDGVLDVWNAPYRPRTVSLRIPRMNQVLGTAIETDEARAILERLGFAPMAKTEPGEVIVSVPPFRAGDVQREIDLIEEVIRIRGYDKIPENATLPITVGPVSKFEQVSRITRLALVGLGFNEAVTNSFCDESTAHLVSPWTASEPLVVQNTVRRDENRLRVSLLPGLLAVKRTNLAHGVRRSPFFEISRVFLPKPSRASGEKPARDDALPEEQHTLAILADDDLLALKGVLEQVFETTGIAGEAVFGPAENGFFADGACGKIMLDGKTLGLLGEVSPLVAEKYDLPRQPCMAELDFDLLVKAAKLERTYSRPAAYPAAVRDLAAVVHESTPWARIEQCIRDLNIPILDRIEFFDLFRGTQVPKGKKSIAFSLTFRAPDRTLTSDEVEQARQACIKALTAIGAELRT